MTWPRTMAKRRTEAKKRRAEARFVFNVASFKLFVHARRKYHFRARMEAAADTIGITKAQLFRAEHGQPVNIEAFLRLCLWMEVNPLAFLIDQTTGRRLAKLPEADCSTCNSTETSETDQSLREKAA
jgi:hypothetical protein